MPSDNQNKTLVELANNVGDFIRYWGFRRIHGEIWTLLYLTEEPLGPTQLAKTLDVSKSLISSALTELESHELIQELPSGENKKTKFYKANEDVIQVIQKILKTRELELIRQAEKSALKLQSQLEEEPSDLNAQRLKEIISWTVMAKGYVELISSFEDLNTLAGFTE